MPTLAYANTLEQFNRELAATRTYQANFKQVTVDASNRQLQLSQGRMWLMRPGYFRWETDTPNKQILITDSKTLWIYNIDLAQATVQPISKRNYINPAALLTGSTEHLQQQFFITTKIASGQQVFELQPKLKDIPFKSVQIIFDAHRLVAMKVLNNLDETSVFKFSNITVNAPLSRDLFQFKPPRGVDVVKQ